MRLGSLDLDVALEVADGEVVAVLGPNGAGKTTLLRALAGLLPLGEGFVRLGDTLLEGPGVRVPPERRAVGMMFQDYLLFPHLSVLDNVAFGPRAGGAGRGDARRRAVRWLEQVGMGGAAQSRPGALSGGQAQRVALARALATEPALLLLDEPLAALDVEARQSVLRELRRHLQGFSGPSLFVTHHPPEAITLSDHLVVLEGGRVAQAGTVEEVTRRPRSPWVARLVGVNLYRGHARHHLVELAQGGSLVAADGAQGEVFALVRPEAVALYRHRPEGSPRNTWPGTVAGLEPIGQRTRVQVEGPIPVVAEVTPAAVAALELADRQAVWVSVKATEVELYPA
ncbi:MAG: ABC transporter ATP-binding protein [Actinomycetota bacterium]|nr:ABC transporter ATP-binding protein [Actinomycetota bacterium]